MKILKNILKESKKGIKLFFNNLKYSFFKTNKSILNNSKLFYLAVLLDIIFFMIFGFVNESFRKFIQLNLEVLNTVMMTAQGVDLKVSPNLGTIVLNSQTAPYLFNIIFLALLSVVSTYFLISFFIGISNAIRTNIDKLDNTKILKYFKSFYKNSILWVFIYIIFSSTSLYITFINTVRPRLDIEPTFMSNLMPLIGVFLLYYFVTSFSYINNNEGYFQIIKLSTKNILKNISVFLLGFSLINFVVWIMVLIGMLNSFILAFITLVLLSLLMSYLLIYYNNIVILKEK